MEEFLPFRRKEEGLLCGLRVVIEWIIAPSSLPFSLSLRFVIQLLKLSLCIYAFPFFIEI